MPAPTAADDLGPEGPCDVCGRPGRLRHFPGASPTSGIWCERHHRRLLWLHPLGARGRWWYAGAVVAGLLALAWWRA